MRSRRPYGAPGRLSPARCDIGPARAGGAGHFRLGMWHGDALDPRSARTGGRSVQTVGVRQPHDHLLAHVFQIADFMWEYLGSREDLGTGMHKTLPGARMHPSTPHHSTLVPRGTHKYLPPPGNDPSGPSWPVPDTCLPDGARRCTSSATASGPAPGPATL